jgi:3',5'-cyclic-AMP phosphodiesterase
MNRFTNTCGLKKIIPKLGKFAIAIAILASGLVIPFAGNAQVRFAELVTVTEDSFSLYWATEKPQTCTVKYGTGFFKLHQIKSELGRPSQYHFITVAGLKPATKYFYQLNCDGALARATWLNPGGLKTQTLPQGKLLFSFALVSDIHIKEDIAGLIVLPISRAPALSPGFVWKYPNDDYWAFTVRNAVDRINQLPIDFTVVDGDLSAWFNKDEFELAKSFLDKLQKPYHVLRGNHDRQGSHPEDWFKKVFNLDQSYYSFEQKGVRFICLDDSRLSDGWGEISDEEFSWLEKELASHKSQPTFILSHRPEGIGYADIKKPTSSRFQRILSQNPQVLACFYGHGHKAEIKLLKFGNQVIPQIMVPATKEYPSGFGIIRVYQSGMVYNFHRTDCDDCLEWSAITRQEYFGLAPLTLDGKLKDRNLVHQFPNPIAETK